MSDPQNQSPFGGDELPKPAGTDPGTYTQKFNHNPVAARIPPQVGKGVFSTGVLVQDGPGEFVLDFLQGLARPPSIVARVILSPIAMTQFVNSLKENLNNFSKAFGAPAPLPKPPQQNRPTIQELYEHFKLPDEMLSGVYANSYLIAHAPAEFVFDFITGFFPTASVSARTYLSAQQIPRLLDTLTTSLAQHHQRFGAPLPNANMPPGAFQMPSPQPPEQTPPEAHG